MEKGRWKRIHRKGAKSAKKKLTTKSAKRHEDIACLRAFSA
jgi:hypothetical protein